MNEEEGIHDRSTRNEVREPETQVAVVQRLDAIEQTLNRAIDVLSGKIEALFSIFSIIHLRHPLPAMGHWAVSPDFARILVDVILDRKPGLSLALGNGVSTLLCAHCLEPTGHSTTMSLEHANRYVRATTED